MFAFLTDEDFDENIVRALLRSDPNLDIVPSRARLPLDCVDEDVLALASDENRILLSRDTNTMTRSAWERVARGDAMPGLFVTHQNAPIRVVLTDLRLVIDVT